MNTIIQQFDISPHFTSISKWSTSGMRRYISIVFCDILSFLFISNESFLYLKDINLDNYRDICLWLCTIRKIPASIEKYSIASSKEGYFHSCFIHSRKCKEVDLFPYSRFILHCVHSRPSADLDHHSYFWKKYNINKQDFTDRDESKTYCKILKKFSEKNI